MTPGIEPVAVSIITCGSFNHHSSAEELSRLIVADLRSPCLDGIFGLAVTIFWFQPAGSGPCNSMLAINSVKQMNLQEVPESTIEMSAK